MTREQAGEALLELVTRALRETGRELSASAEEFRAYAGLRAENLAAAVGQPGFEEAVRAETDNVLMVATRETIRRADAADARAWGMVAGALAILARLLAA